MGAPAMRSHNGNKASITMMVKTMAAPSIEEYEFLHGATRHQLQQSAPSRGSDACVRSAFRVGSCGFISFVLVAKRFLGPVSRQRGRAISLREAVEIETDVVDLALNLG